MRNVQNRRRHRNVIRPGCRHTAEGGHALKNIVIPVELPPAGHALLKTIVIQAGCPSVEQYIRDLIVGECRAFAEALADEESPDLQELFTVNRMEAARL